MVLLIAAWILFKLVIGVVAGVAWFLVAVIAVDRRRLGSPRPLRPVEYLVLAIFCGLSAGFVAKIKGGPFWIWFLVGLVLPLIGTLAALFMRWDRPSRAGGVPSAATCVPIHDQVCMRCGRDLDFPASPPRSPRP